MPMPGSPVVSTPATTISIADDDVADAEADADDDDGAPHEGMDDADAEADADDDGAPHEGLGHDDDDDDETDLHVLRRIHDVNMCDAELQALIDIQHANGV